MYVVLKRLENGEMLRIASRNDLTQAKQLVQSLNACWPATAPIPPTERQERFGHAFEGHEGNNPAIPRKARPAHGGVILMQHLIQPHELCERVPQSR